MERQRERVLGIGNVCEESESQGGSIDLEHLHGCFEDTIKSQDSSPETRRPRVQKGLARV